MTDKPMIVVFPTGQLSAKDKERMTKAGILAVEAQTPKDVVQLHFAEPLHLEVTGLTGDALVRAALMALASQKPASDGGTITHTGRACHEFVVQLAGALKGQP